EHAWVVGEPTVGEGTWIGAFTLIDGSGGLTIGAGCDISSGAQIYTHSSAKRCVSGRRFDLVERRDLSKVRTGRAHAGMLDSVRVDYYGVSTPLAQHGAPSPSPSRA
ncbi:MAG: ribosome recycling factor, partial [Chitinophagaceae bacterium]